MNYYEHHIGDYDKNTSHLTACEDGIYSRLIRRYMDKEAPLPADVDQVKRLARARDKLERKAVDDVLAEFFTLEADGWHHKTCDESIAAYQAGEPEREVKKANEDNRLKRHRAERAELFKIITDAGEHAPWNISIADLRDMAKRLQTAEPATPVTPVSETPPATAPATPATATHTPIPITQTPDTSPSLRSGEGGANKSRTPRRTVESTTLTAYLEACKAMGVKPVPESHPIRAESAAAGITPEMLQVAWIVFRRRYTEGEKGKGKRYKDWAAHFANAVRGRWGNLWIIDEATNQARWSSNGLQEKAVLDARAKAREVEHEPA